MLAKGEVSKARVSYIEGAPEQHHLSSAACSGAGKAFGNEILPYGACSVFLVSTMAALAQEEENECGRGRG